jgi:hypothetical protein
MGLGEHTRGLYLATILAVAIVGSLPALLRVLRMRRAEQVLRWARWPFLHAMDSREGHYKEPPGDGAAVF